MEWSAPLTGGAPTGYTLQAGSGPGLSNIAAIQLGTATTLSVSGVPSGIYYVRVVAINAAGTSPVSNEIAIEVTPW